MIPTDLSLSLRHVDIHRPLCHYLALPLSLLTRDKGAECREHHHGAKGEGGRSERRLKKGMGKMWL